MNGGCPTGAILELDYFCMPAKKAKFNSKQVPWKEGEIPNPPKKSNLVTERQKPLTESDNSFVVLGDPEAEVKEPEKVDEVTSHPTQDERFQEKETEVFPESQDSETEEEASEEEERDLGSYQGSSKKSTRGRKSKKEMREKETYKDKLQGSQPTIQSMLTSRTRNQGQAPKGATSNPKSK